MALLNMTLMDRLIQVISKLSHSLGEMEELAKEHYKLTDLTVTQMHYLEAISALNNPNITELATEMQLTKPTVTVAVDKLIERDYLFKVQSDEDRRSAHLHLTEKGQHINEMHLYAHERFAELIRETLNENEIDQMEGLLEKLFAIDHV